MRDRVKAATLVSAIAPPGMGISLAGMDPVLHGMWRLASISRALIAVQLATLRFEAQHHSELLLHSLYATAPRCDREIVALLEVRVLISAASRKPSHSGPGRGPFVDLGELECPPRGNPGPGIRGMLVQKTGLEALARSALARAVFFPTAARSPIRDGRFGIRTR